MDSVSLRPRFIEYHLLSAMMQYDNGLLDSMFKVESGTIKIDISTIYITRLMVRSNAVSYAHA